MAKGKVTMDGIMQKLDQIESGLHKKIDGLSGRFDGLETRFDGLETRFDDSERRFDDFVNFVTENVAMKEDTRRLEQRMSVLEDHQVKLIQTMEIELVAPTLRLDRMDGRLHIVETKLGLAT